MGSHVLPAIDEAFPLYPVPNAICNRDGFQDPDEQRLEKQLRNRTWADVSGEEWEQICFTGALMTTEAKKYFLPSLLKSLLCFKDQGGTVILVNSILGGEHHQSDEIWSAFSDRQRAVIRSALKALKQKYKFELRHALARGVDGKCNSDVGMA